MRWMGLDYGDRRIGVALSDEMGWTAQGLEVIQRRRNPEEDLDRIRQIAQDYGVTGVVIGLPKNMNGTVGPRGEICIAFADTVRDILQLPVQMWDERLTTVAAERTLLEADVSRKKRKLVIDKMAAALILQGFLDSKSKG
jgi:putative holliday junction resolvase